MKIQTWVGKSNSWQVETLQCLGDFNFGQLETFDLPRDENTPSNPVTMKAVRDFLLEERARLFNRSSNIQFFVRCGRDTFEVKVTKKEFLSACAQCLGHDGFLHQGYDDGNDGLSIYVKWDPSGARRTTVILGG